MNHIDIDQNALSRQLAVYGAEVQLKLMKLKVFIHGITGIGIEVAKNLILAGPNQVTLFDTNIVSIADVGRNFYCDREHVGKLSRAEACLAKLKQLNPKCNVNISTTDDIDMIATKYQCVVILDHYDRDYLTRLNNKCRIQNCGFILGGILGLYGYTFVDFGNSHKIYDKTGEELKKILISGISNEKSGTVQYHQQKKQFFYQGQTIQFKDVEGMEQINGKRFKIQSVQKNSFKIGDTSQFSLYKNGGIAVQVKIPQEVVFRSFEQTLQKPFTIDKQYFPVADYGKYNNPMQLHIIYNGVLDFFNKKKRIPHYLKHEQAEQLMQFVKLHHQRLKSILDLDEIDEKLVQNVALYAQTQIAPVCSFWGGIICQEVVKLTGKYSPLQQWFHHDFFEIISEQNVQKTINEQNRYNDYIILFGDKFHQRCRKANIFVAGAGALGCEYIKLFAQMGFSTQQNSKCTVTDDDNIQISNLNRQFLFRKEHIGKNKSQTACQIGRQLNSKCNFQSFKERISKQNQEFFNDPFWIKYTIIVNAVDNIKARNYIDQKCIWYQKPLFEAGTLGTKCHSQIIIPFRTVCYSQTSSSPREDKIPQCTLKNFPYLIEHAIQWARQYFEGVFSEPSIQFYSFCKNQQKFLEQLQQKCGSNHQILKSKIESIQKLYKVFQLKTYKTCVEFALNIFQSAFNKEILQLLNTYPQNHVNSDSGRPFWSGLKKVPQALSFDKKDSLHIELIQAGANIFATIINIPKQEDIEEIIRLIQKIQLQSQDNKHSSNNQYQQIKNDRLNEQNEQHEKHEKHEQLSTYQKNMVLIEKLKNLRLNGKDTPTKIQFQKDDPTNWHIEFISAVSNLRARNYKIEQVSKLKVKLIAGKIIPAIATTTAMICGAIGIEIIKYFLYGSQASFKNSNMNLAHPMWIFCSPIDPLYNKDNENDPILGRPVKVVPQRNDLFKLAFTKWDKIFIKGPMTAKDMITHFQTKYNIKVSIISYDIYSIYCQFDDEPQQNLDSTIEVLIQMKTGKQLLKQTKYLKLQIGGKTRDQISFIMPIIRYQRF